MDEHAITGLMTELHAKLASADTITERDRELLTQLSADIQSLLANPGAAAAAKHRSITGRIGESITRFDLTDVMARISKRLADMGI